MADNSKKLVKILNTLCISRVGAGCIYNYDCKLHDCNTEYAKQIEVLFTPSKKVK